MKSPNKKHQPKHTSKPRWVKRANLDYYILFVRYVKGLKNDYLYIIPHKDKSSRYNILVRRNLSMSIPKENK